MPRVDPPHNIEAVSWPEDEGCLGVVGVAPWATIDFLATLYGMVAASKDWHYPRVIVDNNPKIPSRGRHLELGEPNPAPAIGQTISELLANGADIVAVICNTAHILYPQWAAQHSGKVLNIVDETVRQINDGSTNRVAVFASRSLTNVALYDQALNNVGISTYVLDEGQKTAVYETIENVKQHGSIGAAPSGRISRVLEELRSAGVEGVVLGCTELSSIAPLAEELGLRAYDSNRCLAVNALRSIRAQRVKPGE